MSMCSAMIKGERFEKQIEDIAKHYKPIQRSSFNTITSTLMNRIEEAKNSIISGNNISGAANYLCKNVAVLEAYILTVSKDRVFGEHEASEPFGVFSMHKTPFLQIPEREVKQMLSEPLDYVPRAISLYENNS